MTRLDLIIIGALVVVSGLFLRQCHVTTQLRNENENLVTLSKNLNSEVEREKNKYGREVAKRKQAEISMRDAKEVYGEMLDSLAESVNVKTNRIAEVTRLNSRLKVENLQLALNRPVDTVYLDVATGDTIRETLEDFKYREKYFQIQGSVVNDIMLRIDSIVMNAPMDVVLVWQRKKLRLFGERRRWLPRWGSKEYELRATSPNPALHDIDIQSFKISKR